MAEDSEGSNKDFSFVTLRVRRISATLDCARRLFGVTACACTSSVIFVLACLNRFCTTLTVFNKGARECAGRCAIRCVG